MQHKSDGFIPPTNIQENIFGLIITCAAFGYIFGLQMFTLLWSNKELNRNPYLSKNEFCELHNWEHKMAKYLLDCLYHQIK